MKRHTILFLTIALLLLMAASASAMKDAGPCKNDSDCSTGALCRWWGGYNAMRCIVGEQNDYCNKKYAGNGSKGCGGSLICRQVRLGETLFGQGEWACVGRGWQNDFCAQGDAGNGSATCGGSLKCRHTGKQEWSCVGRGQYDDLCSQDEAGAGSWNCGGSLKCRKRDDGKYRCR